MTPQLQFRLATPADFAAAATGVARHVHSVTPSVPVLTATVLTATADGVELAGYDRETATWFRVDAEVTTPGRVLVSGRLLAEVTKLLPQQATEITADADHAVIHAGASRVTLPLLPIEDYPQRPVPPPPCGEVDAAELASAVGRVATTASGDVAVPGLTGVAVDVPGGGGGSLRLFATDRYRMAAAELAWTPTLDDDAETVRVLVPAKTLDTAAKALAAGHAGTVRIGIGDNASRVSLATEHRQVTLACLAAEPPLYERVLDLDRGREVTVPTRELDAAVKRLALHRDTYGACMTVFFEENTLRMSVTGESGGGEETLAVDYDADPVAFGMKPANLAAALTTLGSDLARITLPHQATQSWLLRPVADDGSPCHAYRHVVMPVRLAPSPHGGAA